MTAATRRIGLTLLGLALGAAGSARADLSFEITVTGQIDYISDTLGLLDSSVRIGTPYEMSFIFSYNATLSPVAAGFVSYSLATPVFSSIVTYGDYTITSTENTSGSLGIWNNYVFSGRGVTDGFQIFTAQNFVVSTNPSAQPLFSGQNSVDAFDSSHSVFSSTQLPPVPVYNAADFENTTSSNALGFISFLHPSATDYADGPVVGGSYSTINAQYITPEPSSLVLLITGSLLAAVYAWHRHGRVVAA